MLQRIKQFFIDFVPKDEENNPPNYHFGIPVRWLDQVDDDGDTQTQHAISKEELLKFLKDNNFEPTPVHVRK